MARSLERLQDSRVSIWGEEPAPARPGPGWLQALKGWQRWAEQRRQRAPSAAAAAAHDHQRAEVTTQPEPGRGQALRLAHRALRDRMRAQRGLRRVLPHLYFIERALSRQGSVALLDMPVWVLQRGLQQLSRLPADSLTERTQLSVLQQRLVEAIRSRSLMASSQAKRPESPDSFMGGFDSQLGARSSFNTGPGALEVSEVPRSVYDDLLQGTLPDRAEAANTSGWHRS